MNNEINNQNNKEENISNNSNYFINNKDYIEGEYTNRFGARSYYYVNKNPFVWAFVIFFIVFFIGVSIYSNVSFDKAVKDLDNTIKIIEETKKNEELGSDLTLGENDLKKRNQVIEDLNNVFMFTEFSPYIDYIQEDNFKYMFFVYLTKDYSDNTKTLVTGEKDVDGAYSINVNNLNSYYFKFFSLNFDYSKLMRTKSYYGNDDEYYPQLIDNTIYGKYNTDINVESKFKYVKTRYNENSDVYADIMEYTNKSRDESYYVALRYTVDPKGFISYKSFKVVE